jgi:hypothetical protein
VATRDRANDFSINKKGDCPRQSPFLPYLMI